MQIQVMFRFDLPSSYFCPSKFDEFPRFIHLLSLPDEIRSVILTFSLALEWSTKIFRMEGRQEIMLCSSSLQILSLLLLRLLFFYRARTLR